MTLQQRRLAFWGGLGALLVIFLVYAFRPRPVPVDFAEVKRGRLTVTIDEEGETRVREGRLVRPFDLSVRSDQTYHFVCRPADLANDPRIRALRDWLVERLA